MEFIQNFIILMASKSVPYESWLLLYFLECEGARREQFWIFEPRRFLIDSNFLRTTGIIIILLSTFWIIVFYEMIFSLDRKYFSIRLSNEDYLSVDVTGVAGSTAVAAFSPYFLIY